MKIKKSCKNIKINEYRNRDTKIVSDNFNYFKCLGHNGNEKKTAETEMLKTTGEMHVEICVSHRFSTLTRVTDK